MSTQGMPDAVALMTTWTESTDTDRRLFEEIMLAQLLDGDDFDTHVTKLLTGFVSLSGYLLALREEEVGPTPRETLQYVARVAGLQ